MNILKHYKMFKKGKNWCYMAIATIAVTFGAMSISTQANADADSTANNQVTTTVQVQSAASDSAISSSATPINNSSAASSDAVSTSSANMVSAASVSNEPASFTAEPASSTQTETPRTNTNLQVAAAQPAQNNGWQAQNGSVYYYRNGQKLTGVQTIDGAQYYFNNQGQQQKDYFLNQDNHTYYFQKNGQRLNDGFYQNWGHTYYFQKNGQRLDDGFYQNWGHMYYFGDGGVRLDNGFYQNWGHTYYFGSDGARWDNRFYQNWGHMYYFGDGGVRLDDGFYQNWGHTYYFQKDGSRLDNGFYTNWGHTYYFGDGGVRLDNSFYNNWGNVYYFGSDGALLTNTTKNLGFGDLTFDSQGRLSSTNSFIGSIVNGAIQGWTQHKILPSLTLAQAILESAWGRSSLSANYHNLFGIKGSYHGMSVNMPTYEEYGGRYVLINDAFRRYPDNNASVQDHTDFLVQNSRYHNLIGVRDANTATYLIRADGYATASSYTSSLRSVINTYNLTRYDQVAFRL